MFCLIHCKDFLRVDIKHTQDMSDGVWVKHEAEYRVRQAERKKSSIVNSRKRVTEGNGEQNRQRHYHSVSWFKHPKKTLSTDCSHWQSLQPITAQQCKGPLGYTQPQNMRESVRMGGRERERHAVVQRFFQWGRAPSQLYTLVFLLLEWIYNSE